MKKIYLFSIEGLKAPGQTEKYLPFVDEDRRAKVMRCAQAESRAASLGAGLLLRYAADGWQKGAGEVPLQTVTLRQIEEALPFNTEFHVLYAPGGKPYPGGLPFFYSLSHSGGYVACGISDREIGVDIQRCQTVDAERLGRRFFTEAEAEALARCGSEEAGRRLFYDLWTQKESYGKLTGEGLRAGLSVSPAAEAERLGIVSEGFDFADGYRGCVCSRRDLPEMPPHTAEMVRKL